MIIDDFKEILNKYPKETKRNYKNNKFASRMRKEFTDNLKEFTFDLIEDDDEYLIKISPGMRTWTKRPWAGILNKKCSTTFQDGLYLIYIFDFEKNGVWLSLDLGTSFKSEEKLKDISDYLIKIYEESNLNAPYGFYSDEHAIYDETVLSKFYFIEKLNYDVFKSDLKSLIEIYEYLIPFYNDFVDNIKIDLASNFKEIFDRYEIEKTKPRKGNEFANKMIHEFNENFTDFVSDFVSNDYEYVTKISAGIGKWVGSPWANIRYKQVSESFQNGFYIVTLFNLKNRILSMGLIQGKDKISDELLESRFNYVYEKFLENFPEYGAVDEDGNFIKLIYLNYDDLTNDNLKHSFKELIHIYECLIPYYIGFLSNDKGDFETPESGIGDYDVKTAKYWLYAPGENAFLWDKVHNENIMAIGWNEIGNLKDFSNKEQIRNKLQEIYNDNLSHRNDVNALWQFANEIEIGDIIFAKRGMSEIIGVGFVESNYEFSENFDYFHKRRVNWIKKGQWSYDGNFAMKTLTNITYDLDKLAKIKNLVGDITPRPPLQKYTSEKFLEEVYIGKKYYNILIDLVKNKKNLIFQGAPGVGKTFMAKRLAYSMMGVKDSERVMMVQFHQSYSYEDFVMGYRPVKDGFELKEGAFYRFCKNAEEDSENDYFFIIDEINRGNISKIFGELFMLIENDKRGEKNKIQLLYSDELFFIPKNVYIIGLMNTADRSLAILDYALRRRFAFFDLKPGFDSDGFKDYQENLSNNKFDRLIEVMKELNYDIKEDEALGEGFRIGHSYLCNIKSENVTEKLNYIVEYELIPLLKEYWFDEQDKIDYWSDRLRSVLND